MIYQNLYENIEEMLAANGIQKIDLPFLIAPGWHRGNYS